MPHKSFGKEETTPPVILRRSPRFLRIVLSDPEDPKTPNPHPHRRTRSHSSPTPLSLTTGKTNVSPRRSRSHRSKSKECSQKLHESCNAEKLRRRSDRRNGKSEGRVTRSSRCRDLDNASNGCSSGELVLEEGVTISKQSKGKSLKNKVKDSKKIRDDNRDQFDALAYDVDDDDKISERVTETRVLDVEEGVTISKHSKSKSLKNKVKHSNRVPDDNHDQFDALAYDVVDDDKISERVTETRVLDFEDGVTISKHSKSKSLKNKVKHSKKVRDDNRDQFDALAYDVVDEKISERVTETRDEESLETHNDKIKNGIAVTGDFVVQQGPINVKDVNRKQKCIGVKRTRNQFENIVGVTQGWNKDQELALERAYLEAKPTPHFWKKVSRMVPGKSAQECFDKIHGSHLTPPQPRTRSRARVSSSQNSLLSASKLLSTSSPTTKRPKYRKQKSHIIQRTVRHMLQNQYKAEQDSESDLFSLLEPTFCPSLNLNLMLTTPDRNQETDDLNKRSSTVRKSVSRFSNSYGKTLVSPPVLKQVKNKALHEKYIDLLNCREANRKAASSKAEKLNKSKAMKQESSAERKAALKAAKNALIFGAKDAINEFQHQQATALNDLFDYVSGDDADEENG